jgi:hypothetical protein
MYCLNQPLTITITNWDWMPKLNQLKQNHISFCPKNKIIIGKVCSAVLIVALYFCRTRSRQARPQCNTVTPSNKTNCASPKTFPSSHGIQPSRNTVPPPTTWWSLGRTLRLWRISQQDLPVFFSKTLRLFCFNLLGPAPVSHWAMPVADLLSLGAKARPLVLFNCNLHNNG